MRRDIADLIDDLIQQARAHELKAARAREFILDGEPIPEPMKFALDAAVQSGVALGLSEAVQRIRDAIC